MRRSILQILWNYRYNDARQNAYHNACDSHINIDFQRDPAERRRVASRDVVSGRARRFLKAPVQMSDNPIENLFHL
jgi:hypothetical protein